MQIIDFVAGLSIKEAISRAKSKSVELKEPVLADINDIILIIDKNTDMDKKLKEYYQKSKFKFELENMKHKRQNEK